MNATFEGIGITVTESNTKSAGWTPSGNYYRCTVRNNGKSAQFDFWGSVNAMQNGAQPDPLDALHSWMGDALTGYQYADRGDIDDLAAEFGYDKPSEAIRVWTAVNKARKQAERLGLDENSLADLYNGMDR